MLYEILQLLNSVIFSFVCGFFSCLFLMAILASGNNNDIDSDDNDKTAK